MEPRVRQLYLTCPRHKSRQKKHIDICRQCQWNTDCEPYQRYDEPEPLLDSKDSLATLKAPPAQNVIIKQILNELEEIVALLETKAPLENKSPVVMNVKPLVRDQFWENIKKELREIKNLC